MTGAARPRVAVIEDEDDLRDSMTDFLAYHGYPVWGAGSAEEFYRRMVGETVDVLVLDLNLPGEDGLSVAAHVSARQTMAVVILSGRNTLDDRLAGLRAGADRYLVKPIDLRELTANVDAAWFAKRRTPPPPPATARGWCIDTVHWVLVSPDGRHVALTANEFRLMRCLAEAGMDNPVPKAAVAALLGGVSDGFHRIDVMLGRLRKKVADASGHALPVRAVHGRGLALTAPVESSG